MVARYTGAGLGLLAFTVTIVSGLLVGNPVEVTLARSILALLVFCLLGLILGSVARRVVAEYEQQRKSEITERYRQDTTPRTTEGSTEETA